MDLAPHGLDLAATLLGEAVESVAAFGQLRVHAYGVEDGAVLIGRTTGGTLLQLHVAYNCPEVFPRRRLEVIGTRAQIVASDTMGQAPGGTMEMTSVTGEVRRVPVPGSERSPFLNQVETFAACLLSGEAFPFSAAADLHTMELIAIAQEQVRLSLVRAA